MRFFPCVVDDESFFLFYLDINHLVNYLFCRAKTHDFIPKKSLSEKFLEKLEVF